MSKRRYQKGQKIVNIATAIAFILAGANLYYRDRIKPAAFFKQWQVAYLLKEVSAGNIFEAERIATC